MQKEALRTIHVRTFTNGIVGPSIPMLGPVADGGTIVAESAPGCWGPMITPSLLGSHEVTTPVAVEGAAPSDAIAIRIQHIRVTSVATASGTHALMQGRYHSDPVVDAFCPGCGTNNPPSRVEAIGCDAIHCAVCGAVVSPFRLENGYTIVFDNKRQIGLTLGPQAAQELARRATKVLSLPRNSQQNPALALCPTDIPGVVTRLRPFIGNLGTSPAVDMPDNRNAGDLAHSLIRAPHGYAITEQQLEACTDAHMDIDSVREGATLICPVKLPGGGLYLGDVHAMQGDGEIAGHTTDVSAKVTLQVRVVKGLRIGGPILLPPLEDLPILARPLDLEEGQMARRLAERFRQDYVESTAPIQMVGSGQNLNEATANGVTRLADLLGMPKEEVQNRVTISGAVEIGRLPGVVTITMLAPLPKLRESGLIDLVRAQYAL